MRSNAMSRTIALSRQLIEPFVVGAADIGATVVPADTQALRLMLAYLQMLEVEEAITDPSARHLAVMHVHDLAALRLGATREARLAAIKADILDDLDDPHLPVTAVAARQRVTPRYVAYAVRG